MWDVVVVGIVDTAVQDRVDSKEETPPLDMGEDATTCKPVEVPE